MSNIKITSRLFLILLFLSIFSIKIFSQVGEPADTTIHYFLIDTLHHELDDVVVTGTRSNKKIIDIPYPVVRINNSLFQYDRKVGVSDVLQSIPGMFLQSRYGNHDVRISIRGFGSRSNSGIRGVRILLDGIPESEPDGQTRIEAIDFNSIGRIEIVKGNSSSLYTNAPGGVVNFINDVDFPRSFAVQFNQFGSFNLRRNGFKTGIRTDRYGFLATYSYQNYKGYRVHNNEYWHIFNTVLEVHPGDNTSLKILGYFVDGLIKLPGSLTKEEFEEDPFQPDQRQVDRDSKRLSTKGRLGVRFNTKFGSSLNNEIEITAYGTIKYFHRPSRTYKIINRNGLGLITRYANRSNILGMQNEFTIGADIFLQPARIEFYDNINGQKGDQLLQLLNEGINNTGFYVSNNFELLRNRMFILLSGRYDYVAYDLTEETLPSRTDQRTFNAFTPKIAMNYKITPHIAVYTSFGLSFDSPAKNELDPFDPADLYNQELQAQESKNFELGIKGNIISYDAQYFRKILFEATFFNINIDNEIVPFEVLGDVFFRNAAETNRMGLELGTQLEVVDGLEFIFSYTYSDFSYNSYFAKTIDFDSTGNFVESEEDFSDNIVPSVPEHNIFISLAYSYSISLNLNGFIKFSYMGVSGLWVDDANSDKTDAYNLLNSVLGFDMKFGNFNLLISGGVNNIFDLLYVGFTNTNSADKRFYEVGAPRNYFASLNLGYTF
ncbi:MAG: TonB-dependent receptor [Bacteroidetes bacterium]|nr:TonB-dependent receptor [Bacteroidota bacterium]